MPVAPTMASLGLARMSGRASNTREPGFSSRVKQSFSERKSVCFASLRSSGVNRRQTEIATFVSSGLSMRAKRPISFVSAMRGTRLVSRKFRSSCATRRLNQPGLVIDLSFTALSSAAGTSWVFISWA